VAQNPLILASTSSIRRRLLSNAGLNFEARPAAIDEELLKRGLGPLHPETLAKKLAEAKALSLATGDEVAIGADQTLSCNGKLFSKPPNIAAAREQLIALRGQTHVLASGVAVAKAGRCLWSDVGTARLTMRSFTDTFLDNYLARNHGSVCESVGSYKLEEEGIQLFENIEGDYFTILGLPLLPLLAFLRRNAMVPQ
jgi:septum formation protein